jgi:adenylate cyclase
LYPCSAVNLFRKSLDTTFQNPAVKAEGMQLWQKKKKAFRSNALFIALLFLGLLSFVNEKVVAQQNGPDYKTLISRLNQGESDTARITLLMQIIYSAPDGIWELYNVELKTLCEKLQFSKNPEIKKKALAGLATALNDEGYSFDLKGNKKQALESYSQSLRIMRQVGDSCQVATTLNNIGALLEDIGDAGKAEKYYLQSLSLRLHCDDKKNIAQSYSNLGLLAEKIGNYSSAINYLRKSLAIREAINDQTGICVSLINLGLIYGSLLNDQLNAMKLYRQSLSIANRTKDDYHKGIALNNIGGAFLTIGEIKMQKNTGTPYPTEMDSALHYFTLSLELRSRVDDQQGMSSTVANLGKIYLLQRKFDLAEKYLKESLDIRRRLLRKNEIAFSLTELGKLMLLKKEYSRASKYADEALKLSQELGWPENLKRSALLQYEIALLKKDYPKSLEMYKTYINMRDTIENEESRRKLIRQQYQIEYESKTRADKLLAAKEKKLLAARFEQEKLRRQVLFGFVILLTLFGFFMANRFNFIRKQKLIIEIKEQEAQKQKQRSDELLLNILPQSIAEELKEKGKAEARHINQATVMFTDFIGFTRISELMTPEHLVDEIHTCFSEFDRIIEKHGIEKIKTIGDSYMAAGGLLGSESYQAINTVNAAIDICEFINRYNTEKRKKDMLCFDIRIGIHTGPLVAGIVGTKKFSYDIWGDTVNTASRIENNSLGGKINISGDTYELIKDHFTCFYRGKIPVKGKGVMDMYFIDSFKS